MGKKEETEFSKGVPHDLSTPEALEKYYITIKSFSNVHKVVAVMIISGIAVFVIRTTYCIGDINIAGDDIPVGSFIVFLAAENSTFKLVLFLFSGLYKEVRAYIPLCICTVRTCTSLCVFCLLPLGCR